MAIDALIWRRLVAAIPVSLAMVVVADCFERSPACDGRAAEPISSAEASGVLADADFSVAEQARAAECGADDVVAVLDGTESAYTFRCVVRRRPIYEPEIGRLPDAASGAAPFVEQNVECLVDADSPNERAAMIERVRAALAEAS